MTEGEILKHFLDNQKISKVRIAAELGMSKQNLFSLFKSKELSEETKRKFEQYFKQAIFTGRVNGTVNIPALPAKANNKHEVYSAEYIELLRSQIEELKNDKVFLKKIIETNLATLLEGQQITVRQNAVHMRLAAEWMARGDKKKLADALSKIDTLVAERQEKNSYEDNSIH